MYCICESYYKCNRVLCLHHSVHTYDCGCESGCIHSLPKESKCVSLNEIVIKKNKTLETIFAACDIIKDGRGSYAILASLTSELGELATEVAVQQGHDNRPAGVDGIFGEAVDVILCAVDMIRTNYPSVTDEDIHKVVAYKCNKWIQGKTKY
jgi:hypothetical protein